MTEQQLLNFRRNAGLMSAISLFIAAFIFIAEVTLGVMMQNFAVKLPDILAHAAICLGIDSLFFLPLFLSCANLPSMLAQAFPEKFPLTFHTLESRRNEMIAICQECESAISLVPEIYHKSMFDKLYFITEDTFQTYKRPKTNLIITGVWCSVIVLFAVISNIAILFFK